MPGYFYPRSPCGERRREKLIQCFPDWISIHALLAESDGVSFAQNYDYSRYFYPRSPCGERRWSNQPVTMHTWKFLSTLSLRRATHSLNLPSRPIEFLSTLSLRRATDKLIIAKIRHKYFYPRSPCGERLVY